MSRRRIRRRAFTLLEIVMFSTIGAMVLYITYEIFLSSSKQGVDLDTKLRAVQGAQLLLERLERDLKHMVYSEGVYELHVSQDGRHVRFYVFDGHGRDITDGNIPVHLREYRFDAGSNRVLVDGSPFAFAFFRDVQFSLTNAGDPEGDDRPVLTMRVGGVADDRADLPEEELDLRKRADFVSSVGLAAIASAKRTPGWRSNLSYRVQ